MDEKVREVLEWLKVWGQKEWPPEQQREAEAHLLDMCIPFMMMSPAEHVSGLAYFQAIVHPEWDGIGRK